MFNTGDNITYTCKYLGVWTATIIEVLHFPDGGVTYETLGWWADQSRDDKPTLKRLGPENVVLHQ
jgi:hypothetical protein